MTDDQRDPSHPAQTDGPVEVHDVALSEIPHVTFCEKDAGPYLTAAVVLAKDPSTGTPNLSYHRMQIIDETELRARLSRRETCSEFIKTRRRPVALSRWRS